MTANDDADKRDSRTKKDIVKAIAVEIGLTQMKTREIVQKTLDAIIEALVTEERIELRNFGVFAVKRRAARKARNPKSGDTVDVPAKLVVTFKPGKIMEQRVQEMEQNENAVLRRQIENAHYRAVADSGESREADSDD